LHKSLDEAHDYAQSAHHWKQEADTLSSSLQHIRDEIDEYAQSSCHWKQEAETLQATLQQIQADAHNYAQSSHHWWLIAEQNTDELASIRNSLAWKTVTLLQKPRKLLTKQGLKHTINDLLLYTLRQINTRPYCKAFLKRTLEKYPFILEKLYQYPFIWEKLYRINALAKSGVMTGRALTADQTNADEAQLQAQWLKQSPARVKEIYQTLKYTSDNTDTLSLTGGKS
jgi:hypothetical protein